MKYDPDIALKILRAQWKITPKMSFQYSHILELILNVDEELYYFHCR